MNIDQFRVTEGTKLNLKDHDPAFSDGLKDKSDALDALQKNIERMTELQDMLYAQDIYSLLIVFQAMDAAGKDGAIKHVMSGVNPQGVSVASFKAPSAEERDHDYLWRHQKALPERGKIGIFNRSHYEEVLVVRVHQEILQGQQLPPEIKNDPDIWQKRFNHIRDWEQHLTENGTHIIKFFLNVSREEQKKRFLERIAEPEKNWKFSIGDVRERSYWNDYMRAYEDAISATSTDAAPWYVIPADKKWYTRLAISEVIVNRLENMNLHYPKITDAQREELIAAKTALES
ncbi:MAG: polyphosphate kinase 2 family protein [Acidobacteriota bacterium]|nr:MAG: polyphosphate kinase 2 family protein [Acidobacteriota bacterium]